MGGRTRGRSAGKKDAAGARNDRSLPKRAGEAGDDLVSSRLVARTRPCDSFTPAASLPISRRMPSPSPSAANACSDGIRERRSVMTRGGGSARRAARPKRPRLLSLEDAKRRHRCALAAQRVEVTQPVVVRAGGLPSCALLIFEIMSRSRRARRPRYRRARARATVAAHAHAREHDIHGRMGRPRGHVVQEQSRGAPRPVDGQIAGRGDRDARGAGHRALAREDDRGENAHERGGNRAGVEPGRGHLDGHPVRCVLLRGIRRIASSRRRARARSRSSVLLARR